MQLPQTNLQHIKTGLHSLQAVLIFIGFCLCLGMFAKGGTNTGEVWWYFALTLITIPFLIYQTAVPIFPRAARFANIYAYAALDSLLTILWLSGWAAMAAYAHAGVSAGEGNKSANGATGCSAFALSGYGSEAKCHDADVAVAIGVLVFLLWAGTAAISVFSVLRYRRDGILPGKVVQRPGQDNTGYESAAAFSDPIGGGGRGGRNVMPKDEAWNADVDHEHDEWDEEHHAGAVQEPAGPLEGYGNTGYSGAYTGLQQHDEDTEYVHVGAGGRTGSSGGYGSNGAYGSSSASSPYHTDYHPTTGQAHPGRPLSFGGPEDLDTVGQPAPPYSDIHHGSNHGAMSPVSPPLPPQHPGGNVPFPQGNYGL